MGSYANPDLDIQDEITVLVTGFGVRCQIPSLSLPIRPSPGLSHDTRRWLLYTQYNLGLII